MRFNKRMINKERILTIIKNYDFDVFDNFIRSSDAYIAMDYFSGIFKTIYDDLDEGYRRRMVLIFIDSDPFSKDFSKLISILSHPNNKKKHKVSIFNYVYLFSNKWGMDPFYKSIIEKI